MTLAERLKAWAKVTVQLWDDMPGDPFDCNYKTESFHAAALMHMAGEEIERSAAGKAQRSISDDDVRAVMIALYKGEG